MNDFVYLLSLNLFGFISLFLLFYHFPMLEGGYNNKKTYKISVIIPVRNEQTNITNLLYDLGLQTLPPHEIICVDDMSEDDTAQIISRYKNVKLLQVVEDCTTLNGKAQACQLGAENSNGELLLFLDADVRLREDALCALCAAYAEAECTVTVQPFHRILSAYERLSMFFNLIQLAGNASCTAIKSKPAGLFGPVIMMDKNVYNGIGGHEAILYSVVDDLSLGQSLVKNGQRFEVLMGGDIIKFRMYPHGIRSLFEGWVKNIATGASFTSPVAFILCFFWLTGCTSSLLIGIEGLSLLHSGTVSPLLIMVPILYLVWAFAIYLIGKKVGNFGIVGAILYPITLVGFLCLFCVSLFKKLFHLSVRWKGRHLRPE